jgi:undecaprenyl-diphosphatase
MTAWEALFLGMVQGLTEFLPVSSSGHLVFFQKLFGIEEGALIFDVAVHVATAVALFTVFWKDIWSMIRCPFSRRKKPLCRKFVLVISISIMN